MRIPLIGEFQMENAANAVTAIELLKGATISKESVADGLAKVNWPGRLQVLGKEPWVIVDGAHNAYSMQQLGKALKDYFHPTAIKLILGFGNDKDIPGMVREAVKFADEFSSSIPATPRQSKARSSPPSLRRTVSCHGWL